MPWLNAHCGECGAEEEELKKGISVEKEHLGTIKWLLKHLEHGEATEFADLMDEVAKRIAQDHLNELPDYYSRLEKMEKGGS
jgi:hypothetical protein